MRRTPVVLTILSLLVGVLAVVAGAPPAAAARLGTSDTFMQDLWQTTYAYGDPVLLNAGVFDDSTSCKQFHDCDNPTGFIDFYSVINGVQTYLVSKELEPLGTAQGIATIQNFCCLPVGTQVLRANYVSGNFDFSTDDSTSFTVTKAATTTTVTQSSTTSVFGQPVTFNVHVAGASNPNAILPLGSVSIVERLTGATITYGTAALDAGDATITTSQIPPGSHSLIAVYGSDTGGHYNGSESSALNHVVSSAATTTSLGSTATSTTFGQSITFTATVAPVAPSTGAPGGTVTFYDGASPIGSASLNQASPDTAAMSTGLLQVGTHTIHASYAGAGGYAGSTSGNVTVTVAKASTSTVVTSSQNPSTLGQAVTFTAKVTGAGTPPTGSVQFKDGATNLGAPVALTNGIANLTTAALGGGSHAITAVYPGDSNYTGSTSPTLTQTVTCDRVYTGSVNRNVTLSSGTTCFADANVAGNVTIPAGARISITNSTIAGSVDTSGAPGALVICGSKIRNSLNASGVTGVVVIGDPSIGCAVNTVTNDLTATRNGSGLRIIGNTVGGSVTVRSNAGGPNIVGGNKITSGLACSSNTPAASNGGSPNSVTGSRSGECAAPDF